MTPEEFLELLYAKAREPREEVYEADLGVQRECRHPRWGFVVLQTANGVDQVRDGCPDCGFRDTHNHPHHEHPGREFYPLIRPRRGSSRIDYDDYLATEEWLERREAAKARCGQRCQLCGAERVELNVHHNTYKRLGAELETDLTVLCRNCHESFHDQRELAESRPRDSIFGSRFGRRDAA